MNASSPVASPATPQQGWRRAVKIAGDKLVAVLALILLSPLFLVLAIAVRLALGSPVLFRQMRPGYRGKQFSLVKFRTMTDVRSSDGAILPDADRLTSFGRFLRSTSLDELPEFWNVLRGEMSLVGPRPLLTQYLERYSSEQARRHDVLPGITGWCQVNGRNDLPWEEKFALDVWYVDRWSLGLDLRIIARTFWAVLTREGISRTGHATNIEFMGSEAQQNHSRIH